VAADATSTPIIHEKGVHSLQNAPLKSPNVTCFSEKMAAYRLSADNLDQMNVSEKYGRN
jgi:hypothetical protein